MSFISSFTSKYNSNSYIWLKCTHTSLHEFTLGFNTVAIVFPRFILAHIATSIDKYYDEFFRHFGTHLHFNLMPKDEYLKEFKEKFNLKEFLLEPSVFQHVGLQSSMSMSDVNESRDMFKQEYGPFQSYSFLKEGEEYLKNSKIKFNSNEWNSFT